MQKRRVKKVAITRSFLEQFFMGKEIHYRIRNPLPKNTRIVGMGYDLEKDVIVGIIEHPSFEEVDEVHVPPHYILELDDLKHHG